jgi:stage V sporulation protein S
MNRFFSKLDLRDIKIDPTGSRFPPDGEPVDVDAAEESEIVEQTVAEVAETPLAAEIEAPEATVAPEAPEPAYVEPEQYTNGEALELIPAEVSDVLKVSAKSRPSAVAGAIAGVVRELGRAEVQAIGAGATNQAVKAVAIARDYLRESGIEAVCLPSFIDVTIDNEDRTAILLVVEPRN